MPVVEEMASPSIPAAPLAIDRLAQSVENLRADVAAQGALASRERTTVLDHLARFDQALKIITHEVQSIKRLVVEHGERIEKLEAIAFRRANLITATTLAKRKKKHA